MFWVTAHSPRALIGVCTGAPDDCQDEAQDDSHKGGDDGHEALAGEEAQVGRQLDAVKAVEQHRGDQADHDAAEHTRVDGIET